MTNCSDEKCFCSVPEFVDLYRAKGDAMFELTFGGMNMFVRGDAESNHADSALGHHSHLFHAWSGPPRRTKSEKDARMGAINSSNGIDDILKRAMGNRSSLFKRT